MLYKVSEDILSKVVKFIKTRLFPPRSVRRIIYVYACIHAHTCIYIYTQTCTYTYIFKVEIKKLRIWKSIPLNTPISQILFGDRHILRSFGFQYT